MDAPKLRIKMTKAETKQPKIITARIQGVRGNDRADKSFLDSRRRKGVAPQSFFLSLSLFLALFYYRAYTRAECNDMKKWLCCNAHKSPSSIRVLFFPVQFLFHDRGDAELCTEDIREFKLSWIQSRFLNSSLNLDLS